MPKALAAQLPEGYNPEVAGITADSRQVGPGYVFVAIAGTQADGHRYVRQAADKGAIAVVVEQNVTITDIPALKAQDTRLALGDICRLFYGDPTSKFDLVGVTGTNGKTSVVHLLRQMFTLSGYRCGMVSTTGNYIGDQLVPATHTTPDPVALNALLAQMAEAECDYVFMEVSSHAAHQHRIHGLTFRGGIFTNLTQDHLDYHGTFANYRDAKKMFFDQLDEHAFALVNADDRNSSFMLQNTRAARFTYALENAADFTARILEQDIYGLQLEIEGQPLYTQLRGHFNAYNLLAVYGASVLLELAPAKAATLLTALRPVEGRFQVLELDGTTAVVDYAHTPDALEKLLNSVNELNSANGRVICVAGCGGDRDKTKRPMMGRLMADMADVAIFTSDNPRSENPQDIIDEMLQGTASSRAQIQVEPDRRKAIARAVEAARPGDIVVVAGKGHETYQEIKGQKFHFDDREELLKAFATLTKEGNR